MRYKIGANVMTVHIQCYQKLMQHVIKRRLQMYTVIRITFVLSHWSQMYPANTGGENTIIKM